MKKLLSVSVAITTILWLVGAVYIPVVKTPSAQAATILEGDIVSPNATYTDADGGTYYPYDVFIIKYVGAEKFKRLVLNPQVFASYGHLKWSNIKTVTVAEISAFTTSSLVRATNDTKVYKLIPSGDTGSKQWVETLDCFNSKVYNWNSVYIINSTDRDNYTTGAGICGGGGEGAINLSLATDTPAAAPLPYNASGVPFLKIKVDGSGTISQMAVTRSGVGEAADFNYVYLYEGDKRLTSGRSVSSSINKATFIGLSIVAPTTITLVGDLAGSSGDNGHLNAFSIQSASDVTANGTVGGIYPIQGNSMSITSIQGGTLTITKNGSIGNPTVGQKEAQITQFQIAAAYESINIYRITLYNGGGISNANLTNLKLKDAGNTVLATANSFGSDSRVTFVFSSPYLFTKGDSKVFKVYADVGGKKDDTIKLYFEVSADVKGIGLSYGQGAYVNISAVDTNASDESFNLASEGGELTIAFNGPIAKDVATSTDDTTMLDLSFSAAADLEVRNLTVYICWDRATGAVTMTDAKTEIEDVKIKDKDTGATLMGPTDGSSFTSAVDGALVVCNEATYEGEMYRNWTDSFDINIGQTRNLYVTLDTKAITYILANDGLAGILRGLANLTNPVKYRNTNEYVSSGDIVPSTDITGNKMTVKTSSISIALASIPTGAVDGSKTQAGVTAMGILFTAGNASDMKITSVVLNGYAQDTAGDTYVIGKTADGLYAKNIVNNVSLYEEDGTTKISGPKAFSGGTNDSDVTFDNLSWTVGAGASKKMLVKVDITTTSTSGTYDYVAFDIDAAANITAVDNKGVSRTPSTFDISALPATSTTVYVRKSDGGTLTVAAAVSGIRPESTYVYMGQTGVAFSKFKFTSTIEAFKVDKMTIELDTSGTFDENDMTKVALEYPIDANGTLVGTRPTGYFAGTASITFDLTGKEMYVPKDDYAYVTVYANLANYIDIGNQSADSWPLSFEGDGTTTFHAIGAGSSKLVDASTATITDQAGQSMYLYRTFPSFTLDSPSGGTYSTMPTRILGFTVTNHGDFDLVFNSTSGLLKFHVLGSGMSTTNATFTLYKSDGTKVDAVAVTTPGLGTASSSFDFTDTTITIPKNGTQPFYVEITSGRTIWDENGDWLQFKLEDEANVLKWVDGSSIVQIGLTAGLKNLGIPLNGPTFNLAGL
jgi:hypothetical protein